MQLRRLGLCAAEPSQQPDVRGWHDSGLGPFGEPHN